MRADAAVAVAALLLAAASTATAQADSDPDTLWRIVHEHCVPDQRTNLNPAPCVAVDLSAGEDRGYTVFKDYAGNEQYLLIPTARVTGIEDPVLLRPDAPNYLADAWRARSFTEASAGGTYRGTGSAWPSTRRSPARRTSCTSMSTAWTPMCTRHCPATRA